jgi:predicted GIY-YIG superfamily endonuclease
VLRGQAPPPATAGESCAYVLRRADGHFYAGSTDSLFDRMRSHRQASFVGVLKGGGGARPSVW